MKDIHEYATKYTRQEFLDLNLNSISTTFCPSAFGLKEKCPSLTCETCMSDAIKDIKFKGETN